MCCCSQRACLCWAIDNNLTQRLSLRDPFALVRVKTLGAGLTNTALGLIVAHGATPAALPLSAALILGSLSYGASVVLDAYALRLVGAAREAAYFATAPFVGALVALIFLDESLRWVDAFAMVIMSVGVIFLVRERHIHLHAHEPIEHEHMHVHDEHHEHEHSPAQQSGEPHVTCTGTRRSRTTIHTSRMHTIAIDIERYRLAGNASGRPAKAPTMLAPA